MSRWTQLQLPNGPAAALVGLWPTVAPSSGRSNVFSAVAHLWAMLDSAIKYFLKTQGVCMSGSILDKAIGGALTVLAFWIAFLVLRFVWRMLVGASRRLPEGVEGTARLAGKVAAKAEKSASKAIRAFNEGRKGQ